jgi:hypothetical protein
MSRNTSLVSWRLMGETKWFNNGAPNQIRAAFPYFTFMVTVPKTGTLKTCGFYVDSIASSQTMRAAFRLIDDNAWKPTGADLAYRDLTPALGWNVPGIMSADGTDGGAKLAVTKGQLLAIVIYFPGTAGDVTLIVCPQVTSGFARPVIERSTHRAWSADGSTWTVATDANTAYQPLFTGLMYDDDTAYAMDVCVPFGAPTTTQNFSSSTTPDEVSLRMQIAARLPLAGAYLWTQPGGAFDVVLYDAADAVLATQSFLSGHVHTASFEQEFLIEFDAPVLLEPDTTYRLAFKSTSTSNSPIRYHTLPSGWETAAPLGAECYWSERVDGGAWTDRQDRFPAIAPFFDPEELTWTAPSTAYVYSGEIAIAVGLGSSSEGPEAAEAGLLIEMCFGGSYRRLLREL